MGRSFVIINVLCPWKSTNVCTIIFAYPHTTQCSSAIPSTIYLVQNHNGTFCVLAGLNLFWASYTASFSNFSIPHIAIGTASDFGVVSIIIQLPHVYKCPKSWRVECRHHQDLPLVFLQVLSEATCIVLWLIHKSWDVYVNVQFETSRPHEWLSLLYTSDVLNRWHVMLVTNSRNCVTLSVLHGLFCLFQLINKIIFLRSCAEHLSFIEYI